MPFKLEARKAEQDERGVVTYSCHWLGCNKQFGTAGHVRRHERTRESIPSSSEGTYPEVFPILDVDVGNTPYECDKCDKAFGRSDVRARHLANIHGVKEEMESRTSGTPPSKIRRIDPVSTTAKPVTLQQHTISSTAWTEKSPATSLIPTDLLGNGDLLFTPSNAAFDLVTPSTGFLDPLSVSTGSSMLPPDPGPMVDGSTFPLDMLDSFSSNWDLFGQVFGWGLDNDVDLDVGLHNTMFDNTESGPVSSTEHLSAAWLLCATPRQGSPVEGAKSLEAEQRRDPFGRYHDNPWPNVFRPKVPDRPLTLGGVKACPRPDRPTHKPQAITQTSRNAMLSLIHLSHQSLWLLPDIGDFPDHETLSDFIDLYFEHFHPAFPFIHRPTFLQGDTPVIVLIALAAVGATYADKEYKPLAVALDELVRRMITWMRASDQRSKFDRQALIAYALMTALGIACGSREMFLHAEIARCSLFTTTRRLHLLRAGRSATDDLYARDQNPTVEERYKAWLEDEGRRRLGWGIFFLDQQIATLLNVPPIASYSEVGVPLPSDDKLWEAVDAKAWMTATSNSNQSPSRPSPTFLEVLSSALLGRESAHPLNDWSRSIMAYTLYQFLSDAHTLQRSLISDSRLDGDALSSCLPSILGGKPMHILHDLAQTSLPLDNPSHLRLSSAVLFHHSNIQFTHPGLLEHVKLASGKLEPDSKREAAISWLKEWIKDGQAVRKVLWHAGVLNALLSEFPTGALPEPFWTFDCALIFWAVVKYGLDSVKSRGLRSVLFAANWFDLEPSPVWLLHGGQIVFPFLGSSSNFTLTHVLSSFMDRLEAMPWGLAGQFRQVLIKLFEAEQKVVLDPRHEVT